MRVSLIQAFSALLVALLVADGSAWGDRNEPASSQPGLEAAINALPSCSTLRGSMEQGQHGSGMDQRYMPEMRRAGVKRAFLEIHSAWEHGRAAHPVVVRRLFFSQFDGPGGAITEPSKLSELRQEGLIATLDRVAIERVLQGHLFAGMHGLKDGEGREMYSYVDLFSDPWMPEEHTLVSPLGKTNSLIQAAFVGDISALQEQLGKTGLQQKILNRALLEAVLNRFDNSQAIKILVKAGADVDFHGPDGITPLINAVPRPCNVQALLELGARPGETDKWGRTALQIAEKQKQNETIRLLQKHLSQAPHQGM